MLVLGSWGGTGQEQALPNGWLDPEYRGPGDTRQARMGPKPPLKGLGFVSASWAWVENSVQCDFPKYLSSLSCSA